MWGQDIRVVIIPSFLAIAYLGQSSYLHLISRFQFIASSYLARATWRNSICTWPICIWWLGGHGGYNRSRRVHGRECPGDGLIVFKILKLFLEVNPISVERTLDSTGGNKLRHVIFVIIESGMALFAIQLIRLMFTILPMDWTIVADNFANVINQMLNVIIRSVHFYESTSLFYW